MTESYKPVVGSHSKNSVKNSSSLYLSRFYAEITDFIVRTSTVAPKMSETTVSI